MKEPQLIFQIAQSYLLFYAIIYKHNKELEVPIMGTEGISFFLGRT